MPNMKRNKKLSETSDPLLLPMLDDSFLRLL